MLPHLINSIVIILFSILFVSLSFLKTIRLSDTWKATVTPLASIIGSGFLVVTPLFVLILGKYAVIATFIMVCLAYLLGNVLRFNIHSVEPLVIQREKKNTVVRLEHFSFAILGLAYLISIPFYIKLLSLFILRGFNEKNEMIANCIATVILSFIGIVGKFRGFKRLESLEEYSVNIKLSIIFSMIIVFIIYNLKTLFTHQWALTFSTPPFTFQTVRQFLGTIIIIQGFETSRFIWLAYKPEMRIRTMRNAQIISGIIYVVFVGLALVLFDKIQTVSETSIIDISHKVAVVLPYLLILAAILSQFSAAISDTISTGGLLYEATFKKMKPNNNYLIIALLSIALTWSTNIFQIITLASRAFALYYGIQAIEATILSARQTTNLRSTLRTLLFALIAVVMGFVVIFGVSV